MFNVYWLQTFPDPCPLNLLPPFPVEYNCCLSFVVLAREGSGIDHQYLLSRSKRPLSAVVDNPHRIDSVGVSRLRLESSFPTASQSMLSHSRGPLATPSFAYYRQIGSGQSPGSVYGVGSFPSSFQSHERGPYGGHSSIYRRYWRSDVGNAAELMFLARDVIHWQVWNPTWEFWNVKLTHEWSR